MRPLPRGAPDPRRQGAAPDGSCWAKQVGTKPLLLPARAGQMLGQADFQVESSERAAGAMLSAVKCKPLF